MNIYSKQITILYVEDEKDVREGYVRALERISAKLYSAEDGLKGLQAYKEYKPDIVVTDIKMPHMNGIDMSKAIKEINPEAKIIFTTAHSESAYLLEAIEMQIDGYLLKPVQKNPLLSSIEKVAKNIVLEKENQELKLTLSKMAYTDTLTGVYNRNKFQEIFEYELQHRQRDKNSTCLAILDIDHFKNFNDTYGHLVGDEILIMLAQAINNNTRQTDCFARWGGEEFVLLFINIDLQESVEISKKLKDIIESLVHERAGGITASFGVAQLHDKEGLSSLLTRADKALYKAKQNGRNRVCFIE